jgi:hypothetical protein
MIAPAAMAIMLKTIPVRPISCASIWIPSTIGQGAKEAGF